MAVAQREIEVVGDDDGRGAGIALRAQHREHGAGVRGIEAGGRLVEQEALRALADGLREDHAAGFASGNLVEAAGRERLDVKHALRAVGDKLGKAKEADAAIADIDRALDEAAARRPARHPRVLAIIDREAGGLGNLVAAGPGSWVDELLAVVGGDNVLAASGVRYPKISLEEVLTGDPEIIIDLSFDKDPARKLAAWNGVNVTAVKTGHVKALDDAYLQGPSPRVRQALAALAAAIQAP